MRASRILTANASSLALSLPAAKTISSFSKELSNDSSWGAPRNCATMQSTWSPSALSWEPAARAPPTPPHIWMDPPWDGQVGRHPYLFSGSTARDVLIFTNPYKSSSHDHNHHNLVCQDL